MGVVAIGYVRVSTEGQAEDGVSLAAQRAKIEAWAKLHDEAELLVFEDAGLSGSSLTQRVGLQEALESACERKGTLVVYSLSRLARSTRDTLTISDRLAKAGAELVSLSEKIDTSSASGKMVFRMLAVLAEFERDQISERTRAAMAHLRKQRKRISRFVPYGWDLDPNTGELRPNVTEQAVLTRMAGLRAEGRSLRDVAQALDELGIPTKTGTSGWTAKVVRTILARKPL